ncbi:MAG: PPC domain-containing protein [Myxococcales bacterium]|nr:PPC domain-containing protein [Myxococcales bacterium]MCB9546861.1 PPC domain-containing protein [Myxococcales bacterium]
MRTPALALLLGLAACTEDPKPAATPVDAAPDVAVADATVADAAPPAPDAEGVADAAEPDAAPITPCAGEDDLAPNQRPRQAAPIAPGFTRADLFICPDQADYFALELAAEQRVRLELAADPIERDLDLAVLDAAGMELAGSYGEYGEEALRFVAPAAGTYLVRVQSYRGQTARYRLTVAQGCRLDAVCGDAQVCDTLAETCTPYAPGPCGDDAQEPDDRHEQATALANGPVEGQICPQDRDWFAVDVADGDSVAVSVAFTAGRNVDLIALGPDGRLVDAALGDANPEQVVFSHAPAGRYLVGVSMPGSGEAVDTAYTVTTAGSSGACRIDRDCLSLGLPTCEEGVCRPVPDGGRVKPGGRCGRGADCSDASDFCLQGDPGGHDNICTRECTSADDCGDFGGDGICDRILGAMVCVHRCESDDDCALTRRCEEGECNSRGRCNGDGDCAMGEACVATGFGNRCALVED